MTLFSRPYHIEPELLAEPSPATQELPLEYHLNHYSQICLACARANSWSELTLLSFNRARKARVIRAAPKLEYNLPLHTHHHDLVSIPVCSECAPLAQFALRHLPQPQVSPLVEPVPVAGRASWRERIIEINKKRSKAKQKTPVTDADLIA